MVVRCWYSKRENNLSVQTKAWIRNIRLCRLETAFMHIPSFYQYICISLVQTTWKSIFPLYEKFLYTISVIHSFKCNLYTLYNQFDWLMGLVHDLALNKVCINKISANQGDYLDIIQRELLHFVNLLDIQIVNYRSMVIRYDRIRFLARQVSHFKKALPTFYRLPKYR